LNPEIFIARAEHSAAWAKLRYALWPDCPPERHVLEIQQLLVSEGIVALARAGNEIVGMAEVSIRRDHVEGTTVTPVPYLEGWFVAETHRGQGIGRALLEFVEDWSRAHGYHELASDAELHNTHSIALHTQLGFREAGRCVHFVKRLSSSTEAGAE
jgi:aminoglycoside 6'-N-acetyltransferase I